MTNDVDLQLNDDEQALRRVQDVLDREYSHEPDPDFEARMWQRIEPALPVRRAAAAHSWRWMAAAAALTVAAFVAGRYSSPTPAPEQIIVEGTPADRVLLIDLGSHLDLAEMTLVEFGDTPVVDEMVRARTEDLIAANRLYRGAAMTTGDATVARMLDELERALIEIATAPSDGAAVELDDLRQRIESGGLLLKLRVMRDVLQDRAPGIARAREDEAL